MDSSDSNQQPPELPQVNKRPGFFSRTYFIIPKFQRNFILHVIVLTMIIFGGFYLLESYFLSQILQLEETQFLSSEFLYNLLKHKMRIAFSAKVLFAGLVLITWGIFFSHRIAGPIWRIMSVLEKLENGEEDISFKLRKSDYFKGLAEKLEKFYKDGRLK